MKPAIPIGWLASLLLAGSTACAADAAAPVENPVGRIGIYDSRAIAVAFGASDAFSQWINGVRAERRKAMMAEDLEELKRIDAQTMADQKLLVQQVFSAAPVDNLLKYIADSLPEIQQKAGVDLLVSKWDEATLAKYPAAERVDVTMMLVDAFRPHPIARKNAIEIQKQKPKPLEPAEQPED